MNFLRRDRRLTPQRIETVMAFLRRRAPRLTDLI
jgi:hypothetical protein